MIAACFGLNNPRVLGLTLAAACGQALAMITSPDTHQHILTADDGEVLDARGNRLVIKVASERQLICEYTAAAGFAGPPLHIHPPFDETFLVVEGQLTIRLGDEVTRLEPGAMAFVPGDVPHTFANTEPAPVRFLLLCSPGGFEDYFRSLAAGDESGAAAAAKRMGYAPVNGQAPAPVTAD
jgi:quercetin dioxygenase-like cupin family protein